MRKLRFRGDVTIICGRCRNPFGHRQFTGRPREYCDPCIPLRAQEIEKARPYRCRSVLPEASDAHPA